MTSAVPYTRAWSGRDYDKMVHDTVNCFLKMINNSENMILMGDFICIEIIWVNWSAGTSEKSRVNILLSIVTDIM